MNSLWKRLSVQNQIGAPLLEVLLIGGDISISSCYTGPVSAPHIKASVLSRIAALSSPAPCPSA